MIMQSAYREKGISVFLIWILIGFVIFIAFAGGYNILARQYVCDIDIEALASQSDQLVFSDGVMTVMDSDTHLYIDLNKEIFINYITISVKDLDTPVVNAKIYYAQNANEFDEAKVVNFYLKKGFNEIRTTIREKKYLRLDILGGGGEIDGITISSSADPLYHIPQGFMLFMLIWSMMYFTSAKLGVCYNDIHSSIIMMLEGFFAVCIIITMLFGVSRLKYPLVGTALGVGILIKGSIVILFIAVCMHIVLNNIKNIWYALLTAIMVIGISTVWNIYIIALGLI